MPMFVCRHGVQLWFLQLRTTCKLHVVTVTLTGLFLQINNAYSVLSDASQRLEYDSKLREVHIKQSSEGSPFGSVPQHR